ncbi:YbaN family protein [Shewanella acanthi]|uniref:YbaN family protein n=1 Tax=Shewanella acanthi TaxID=2864212 RepID=UPI001C66155C|nr:YbaN family protein [Shewanella acanthi]QYJ80620.1 YbaN family protein [Shewanella acanthi]
MVLKRGFFLLLGCLALALGLLGIVLPLLPTVPFILLAAFCFARSSERLHHWLMNHPWFSDALLQWQEKRAMRPTLKKKAMWLTGLSFCISIAIVPIVWVKFLLLLMALGLLWYLKSIPEID